MIRLYILILIIIVILILLYIYLTSGNQGASSNQGSSSNQFLKQEFPLNLLDLYESRLYNYKFNRNSCFIHSSLQLLRTFFSLLVIDNITFNKPYINTLLKFNAFDNRKQYFPYIKQNYAKSTDKNGKETIWNYMNPDQQHDVGDFLSEIFINIIDNNIIQNNNIISYDTEMKDIFIKLGVDVEDKKVEYLQHQLENKKVEYNEYMIIHLQGNHMSNFTFTDVTNDIVINNGTYSPYSIVQYVGNGYGGHYVNYSKKPNTQDLKGQWSWYKYDDVNQQDAYIPDSLTDKGITKNPVVILYKRIKK